MAKFTLYGEQPETGLRARFFYDNATSELQHEDDTPVVALPTVAFKFPEVHPVSKDTPGIKKDIRVVKIQLGLACNYSCSYCNQRSSLEQDSQKAPREAEVQEFLDGLSAWFSGGPDGKGQGTRFEFWGGEPLVYWKTLKPLAESLRVRYPHSDFKIISNGGLLSLEINEWLDRLGFFVSISHDGPGQKHRGPDPLEDTSALVAIRDLYTRLHPKGRFSFNAMVHRGNPSRAAINEFFVRLTGDPAVVVGEGSVIDPYDAGGLACSWLTDGQAKGFSKQAFYEIRNRLVPNLAIVDQRINDIVQSIAQRRPATALGQKCGMDRPDSIAVDLRGNVLTCQNASSSATAPNGESHKIGHTTAVEKILLTTAKHWSLREECSNCPVLQSCKGSCMFLEGQYWREACINAFADHLPFFVAAIEHLTGYVVFYIDGPQRESRKDIFGLVRDSKVDQTATSEV